MRMVVLEVLETNRRCTACLVPDMMMACSRHALLSSKGRVWKVEDMVVWFDLDGGDAWGKPTVMTSLAFLCGDDLESIPMS